MEYHESVEFLNALQRRRPKLGTETTARMLSHLGAPHEAVDCVQIAGSNGKGSTARMLESILRESGLDVGLFTSPKLNDLREQIRVNSRKVSKSQVTEYVNRLEPCIEQLRAEDDMPTHFEVITALALTHFGTEAVDVAVLEVGIGGRYDATSVVDPVASAVTSVSLEHTELLGETVEEIARDKAQVATARQPLVTGADGAALEAIRSETNTITVGSNETDIIATENGMRSAFESSISITGDDWALETPLSLLGQHQATNAGIAATLARQVASLDAGTIAAGLRRASWPGRFEIVEREPTVVLDGSHNPGAAATLRELLGRYDYGDLHVVFAAMSDKDHDGMIAQLPAVETAFVTRPHTDRAEETATLATRFEGHAARIERVESVAEATEQAITTASDDDFVLVTGSLYGITEARDRWTRLVVPKTHRRQTGRDNAFLDATVAATNTEDIDYRTVTTKLRHEQAARVGQRFEAIGGTCIHSDARAPEKFASVALSGSMTEYQELVDALANDGLGLGYFAQQLDMTLDETATGTAFDIDRPAVMGIVNVTPDSFYDGGEYDHVDAAVRHANEMVDAGADIIDVGGESTRPGAEPVSVGEEINRVVPVIDALSTLGVPISVDTRKAAVAEAALEAGAEIVNDVSALADPETRVIVAKHDATLVLVHSLSTPVDPERTGTYDDVVEDVVEELAEQILLAERAGIDREQIIVDPGCGFGKRTAESFELIDRIGEFRALGCPVMVGHSRKSMFEEVGCQRGDRLPPTLAVTAVAVERGADVLRVHDAAENAAVVRTVAAVNKDR